MLTIDCNNYAIIDNIPDGTKQLVLEPPFDLPWNNVPNNLTKIDNTKLDIKMCTPNKDAFELR